MANIQFQLASGRHVGITAHGQPDGDKLVIFCHPAPGASTFDPDPRATGYRTVHLIGLDRAGYGASDPLGSGKWPSVAGYAADIGEYLRTAGNVARDLGIHEFDSVGVVGWSAGGRVALALAAAHPTLIDRVVVVGTPAPNDEVPWVPQGTLDAMTKVAQGDPDRAIEGMAELLEGRMGAVIPSDGSEVDIAALLGLGPADEALLELPGVRDRLTEMLHEAFRQGTRGLAADMVSFNLRDWDFDPAAVRARTLLLYGANDPILGREHGDWYAGRIPDSRVEIVPDAGQLAIVPAWDHVLKFLSGEE
jgi:pimeloyl-ACP methyl ester carboxylesterase